MKIVLVVQARMGSTRLPGKVLLQVDGKPMLAYQLDRLRMVAMADEIVVATSVQTQDDPIVGFCDAYGVRTFRGSQSDVLSRFVGAAELSGADLVVRLTADCPLIDPAIIDQVISVYLESPGPRLYVSNILERTFPRGMDVEVFSRELLLDLNGMAKSAYDREHVTPLVVRNDGEVFSHRSVSHHRNLSAYRYTLDYNKDFEQIALLLKSSLPNYSLDALMKRAVELGLDWHDNAEQAQAQAQAQGQGQRQGGRKMRLARFGLGAAQFGMHYGRFNQDGVPSRESTREILELASGYGLSTIDTAHLYGESEFVLGSFPSQIDKFEVITKTPHFKSEIITKSDAGVLRRAFEKSLRLMQRTKVKALLMHDATNLLSCGSDFLYAEMLSLKQEGLVEQIGVSAYSGEAVENIHNRFPLDIVQVPINVLDRRLLVSGTLSRLASSGVEIHARSVFLQGLLLADPKSLSSHFDPARDVIVRFQNAARESGISAAHAALLYLEGIPEISRIIVGVESLRQLEQLFSDYPLNPPELDFSEFSVEQVEILNPVLWVK